MTRSLALMADWLEECGVELAGMESTATYWKPVFYCLADRMERWLLNAAHPSGHGLLATCPWDRDNGGFRRSWLPDTGDRHHS